MIEIMGKEKQRNEKLTQEKNEEEMKVAGPRDSKAIFENTLQVKTILDGYNSGRTYYLVTNNQLECMQLCVELSRLSRDAKQRKEAKGRFEKSQDWVRQLYNSFVFQVLAALLIFAVYAKIIIFLSTSPAYLLLEHN